MALWEARLERYAVAASLQVDSGRAGEVVVIAAHEAGEVGAVVVARAAQSTAAAGQDSAGPVVVMRLAYPGSRRPRRRGRYRSVNSAARLAPLPCPEEAAGTAGDLRVVGARCQVRRRMPWAGIEHGAFLHVSVPDTHVHLPVAVSLGRPVDEFVDDHAASSQCSSSLERTHGG